LPARVPAGLLRRLGAIVYDSVIVIGVLLLMGLLAVPFTRGALMIPAEVGVWAYVFRALQVLLIALFFGYFWTRRGQTVGMVAWRLRITRGDGRAMGWRESVLRLAVLTVLTLPFFLGDWLLFSRWSEGDRKLGICASLLPLIACYAWLWIDRQRLTWHDRLSNTRIWMLPKQAPR
jgi:uncharacterized RDD family membrane protein YckC